MDKSTDREWVVVEAEGAPQRFLGKEFALLDRYALQDAVAETVKRTKYRHKAVPISQCHRMFRGRTCRNGHSWAKPVKSCGSRLCPHCCRQRAVELAGKLQPFLSKKPEKSLRYMVLTEVNCADLEEGRELIWAAWTRFRRSVAWKKNVKGCIVTMEVTYNPHCVCGMRLRDHDENRLAEYCKFREAKVQTDPWHPHLNVMAEGVYFPHAQLCQMWEKATDGRAKVVHISAVKNGFVDLEEGGTSKAARELVKYITKASDLVGNPVSVEQFLDAVQGRRLLRTYGTFYGLKLEEELADSCKEVCPDCGTNEWVETTMIAPQQIAMDFKGVLRDKRRQVEIDSDVGVAVDFAPHVREKGVVDAPAFSRMRKSWDKKNLGFEERHDQYLGAIERIETIALPLIPGWDYSQWLANRSGGVA